MSTVNITGSENGTLFINVKNEPAGFTFLQTLFLSLCVLSSIILFSTLVYYVIRKRALDELRHRLVPLYHFDPTEIEDWEDALLDDTKKENPRSTIQINEFTNNNNYSLMKMKEKGNISRQRR